MVLEGIRRFLTPPEIASGVVIVVAAIALLGNLVSLRLLAEGRHKSLNVRAAYLEVAGDLLGAAAVLVAGVIIFAYFANCAVSGIGLRHLASADRQCSG